MGTEKKLAAGFALLIALMIASGCAITREHMMAYNEAKESFQRATLADAKKCAPVPYATAEAYLGQADHEIAERDDWRENHLSNAIKTTRDKSLEAIKICEYPPATPAATAPVPKPAPAPAAPPPTPAAPPPPSPAPKVAPPPEAAPPPVAPPPPAAPPKPAAPPSPPPTPALPPPPPPPPPAPAAPKAPTKAPEFGTPYFDLNKSNINPAAAKELDQNGALLRDNPGVKVEIAGYADSGERGAQSLSQKRAESAKKYLQDKFNIPADRLVTKGYGASRPVSDTKNKEGRAKNRRVEFRVLK